MRKVFSLLAIFLLTFGLAACGGGEQNKEKSVSKSATSQKANEKMQEKATPEEEKPENTNATTETEENPAQAGSDSQQNQAGSTVNSTTTASADSSKQTNNNNSTANANSAPASTSQTTTSTAPATPAPESQKPATTVTLSIVGPDNQVILSATKVKFSEGETIFNILKGLREQYGIVVESRGSGATAYIEGIEGSNFSYYEFDEGPTSGWVFKQNGASLTKSVGVTAVKDGDRIEGIYTK